VEILASEILDPPTPQIHLHTHFLDHKEVPQVHRSPYLLKSYVYPFWTESKHLLTLRAKLYKCELFSSKLYSLNSHPTFALGAGRSYNHSAVLLMRWPGTVLPERPAGHEIVTDIAS
jgi:hypothetical protein